MRGAALPDESDHNLEDIKSLIEIDRFDITDQSACAEYIRQADPGYVFHLAGFSSVARSFENGELAFKVNTIGTYNIYSAVTKLNDLKGLVFPSSSDVYGPVRPEDLPLQPDRLLNPLSPYAQSKAAAEYLSRIFIDQYKLPIMVVRAFNHTGPRQDENFAIPAFCKKIVEAEKSGGEKTVKVGNLKAARDISDVRDIVRGYRMLAEQGNPERTYQLCSGRSYRMGDLLNRLISFSDTKIKVETDQSLYRKVDIPELRGNYHWTSKDVGWKPHFRIEETLRDTLNWWREKQ